MTTSGTTRPIATVGLVVVATAVSAAVFLLFTIHKKVDDDTTNAKRSPPKTTMGIIATVKMMAGSTVPFDLLKIANDLDSYVFELNLPIPGYPKTVVVADPDDARSILRDPHTEKPHALYALTEMIPTRDKTPSLFGMQTCGLEGEEWHRRRKGTLPAFSSKHVRRMNDVAYKHASAWCNEKLALFASNDQHFDVVNELLKVILRAFCETALNYLIPEEEMVLFLEEWDLAAKEYIFKSTTNPFRKYLELFLPERQRARKAMENLYELFQRVINNYRSLEEPIEGTIINRIMTNPTFKNDDQRRSEVFAYIIAGHDTTAVSLSWTLLELAKNPTEQTRLRDALKALNRDEWSTSEALRKVVQEGMRIHPVAASLLAREIGRDIVTSRDSYFLPKGTVTFLPIYLLHRNHHTFDDADQFLPSRWDNPPEKVKNGFIPFAAGKQNCVGQSLAQAEVHCILARIIQDYEFTVHEEGTAENYLVLKPVGLQMKVRRIQ